MLSSISFATIFLTVNHLFPIFALPPMSKDNVSASPSLSPTHALVKRDWFPADQTCDEPEEWHARNCVAEEVDRIWYDSCLDMEDIPYYGWGICPDDTICMDTYGPAPDYAPTISCVIRPRCDGCKPNITGGPPPTSGQTGVYTVGDTYSVRPLRRAVSVTMETSVSEASVTAFMEGTYQTSLLTLTCRVFLLDVPTMKVPMEITWSNHSYLWLAPCAEQKTRLVLTTQQIWTVCRWENGILKSGTLSTSGLGSSIHRL